MVVATGTDVVGTNDPKVEGASPEVDVKSALAKRAGSVEGSEGDASPPAVAPSARAGVAEAAAEAAQMKEVMTKLAQFSQLTPAASERGGGTSLDFLLDVSVTITADLGRTTLSLGEVLSLSIGSVVPLDRMVSEPVDLSVRGVLLARGEVVVVDEHFAVRIKEIMQPKQPATGGKP
jgi:flagellar motor switch protein FliN/FliY